MPRSASPGVANEQQPERTKRTQVRYGRVKGKFLCDIEADDLAWQRTAAQKAFDANDPKWHQANAAWRDAVEEEVSRRAAPKPMRAIVDVADGETEEQAAARAGR